MIIILPHFHNVGGAGKYIEHFIHRIQKNGDRKIEIIGRFSKDYKNISSSTWPFILRMFFYILSCFSFPQYDGIKLKVKVFYFIRHIPLVFFILILMPLIKVFLILNPKFLPSKIIFTSSIQIFCVIIKYIFPSVKFGILIQENLIFTKSIIGGFTVEVLNGYDFIVSITDAWTSYAAKSNVDPNCIYTVKNKYDLDKVTSANYISSEIYDFIYLGGGQKIKGFHHLCRELKLICDVDLFICFLGNFSTDDLKLVDDLLAMCTNITIDVVGQVEDPLPFIKKSKFVVLPIVKPHFCRPAIEAGLLCKTFIISNFSELSDFVFPSYNCLTFSEEKNSLSDSILHLSSDNKLRNYLSSNNYLFANSNIKESTKERDFFCNL